MKPVTRLLTLLLFVASAQSPFLYADAGVAAMARIVLSLQHFPSDADKQALAEITAGESSDSVKVVADAIANISHSVGASEKAALEVIAADPEESANLRDLALIVVGINHMPSAEAKVALGALAGQ